MSSLIIISRSLISNVFRFYNIWSWMLSKPCDHECTSAETMFGSVGANSPLSYQLKDFGSCSKFPFEFVSNNIKSHHFK